MMDFQRGNNLFNAHLGSFVRFRVFVPSNLRFAHIVFPHDFSKVSIDTDRENGRILEKKDFSPSHREPHADNYHKEKMAELFKVSDWRLHKNK